MGGGGGGGGECICSYIFNLKYFSAKKQKKKLMLNNTAQFLALQYFTGHFVLREFILVLFNLSFCESSFFISFLLLRSEQG